MEYRKQSTISFWVKFIMVVAGMFTAAWICVYAIGIVFVSYKALNVDWSGGVKPVIERVWCGEVGCMDKK